MGSSRGESWNFSAARPSMHVSTTPGRGPWLWPHVQASLKQIIAAENSTYTCPSIGSLLVLTCLWHSHTHMHTHAHAHTCARTHTHTHTCARTHSHTHARACTHTCTHTRTHLFPFSVKLSLYFPHWSSVLKTNTEMENTQQADPHSTPTHRAINTGSRLACGCNAF